MIRLKEELEQSGGDLRVRVKQLESENADMVYLTTQKDKKIQTMEKSVSEMRQKLQQALQSTQYKKSTEIQKVFGKGKDVDELSAQFHLSTALDQNRDPNMDAQMSENLRLQQEAWALEVRRADERTDKFKAEAEQLAHSKTQLQHENAQLAQKL